ncbi:hypothetical protein MFLO_00530 [Listeria floridensis FSL S10-1187]|uniref:DUF805 domain-containing protein n=2 Tax=Listeria floridensis TaxID=1494962 RepID=A0ABN0RID0_9LIST|nr:hypothetical protein MFLO_00530 [Listeria floridensis FSL S10-1187]
MLKREQTMIYLKALQSFWINYINFSGKAKRTEFWVNILSFLVISQILLRVSYYIGVFSYLSILFDLICAIPLMTLVSRRANDSQVNPKVTLVFIGFYIISRACLMFSASLLFFLYGSHH